MKHLNIATGIVGLMFCSAAFAQLITIGTGSESGVGGEVIVVPVQYTAGGDVTGIEMSVDYGVSKFSSVTLDCSVQTVGADFNLCSDVDAAAGGVDVILAATSALSSGLLANITFTLSEAASGSDFPDDGTVVSVSDSLGVDLPWWTVSFPDSVVIKNELRNISTRADVGTGDYVAIAGFIIDGTAPKCVVAQGGGPSMDIPGVTSLPNPILKLRNQATQTIIAENDDWQTQTDPDDLTMIEASGKAPNHVLESAIYECLEPGAYTAILQGVGGGVGLGIVGVNDVDYSVSNFRNISTRANVGTDHLRAIAGFIIDGDVPKQILVRGDGPSLNLPEGIAKISDPKIRLLKRMPDGTNQLLRENDNWGDAPNVAEISATGKAPSDPNESAILMALDPGVYTAIIEGVGGETGNGIISVNDIDGRL